MKKRTKSRVWALQAAYGMHISGRCAGRILDDFFSWRKVGAQNQELTVRLLDSLEAHLAEVDDLLASHLRNWSPQRLAVIDRLLIRLAVTELLYFEDIPPKVTINEYVSLAHVFGTDDSPRFVNGVLDAVNKTIAGRALRPKTATAGGGEEG
ncbi:MAG TPA: transcription antitermination factor NusB [Candidatus Glassbacteria bacterium]|nr:transcription antitermination factor NusB [Candidatus Glassbacteria bacterium]